MSIIEQGKSPFEPYARLMNIIGDQLITDKKVAVIEIIKNSYDADAENVSVRFFNLKNFGSTYLTEQERPYIEIEDDGDGMPLTIIKEVWLRPATPYKLDKKKQKLNFTAKKRVIQGEKGIGRFAIHKLGEKIEVYTKIVDANEIKLELDFTEFNPEKADLFNQEPSSYKLLKDVENKWSVSDSPFEIKKTKGTLIRIYNLRERWQQKDFEDLLKAINRLIPPNDPNSSEFKISLIQDFNVKIYIEGKEFTSPSLVRFDDVIERAPFQLKGWISENGIVNFFYKAIKTNRTIIRDVNLLNEIELAKYNYDSWAIKNWFNKMDRKPHCGEIQFSLYAYDLTSIEKTSDTKDLKAFIKDNFVYVFRDGVRVYPFGEQGFDWLNLDKLRAYYKAGQFLSYNDLVGFVYISQKNNPLLRDTTSREGLVNIDNAYDDFKFLLTAVVEIFTAETKIDKEKTKLIKNESFKNSNEIVVRSFNNLKRNLEMIDDKETLTKANIFLSTVQKHSDLMKERMETVEDLAGLGMAVEKASHDALMLLSQMRINIQQFLTKAHNKDYTNAEAIEMLVNLDDSLNIVYEEMQVIQPLFKFQRKAIQDVSIYDSIEKVKKYFRRDLERKIEIKIIKDKDIVIPTNNGLILQVLINVLDNAIYWVNKGDSLTKEIAFKLNTDSKSLIIADNGPGIRDDVSPMVFNEFFSLKADGRGLGLYIVKEILLRIGAEISLLESESEKILPGANFIIKFNNEN